MSRRSSRRRKDVAGSASSGHEARVGRDPVEVIERSAAGDVVVLNCMDLDPESARSLIARGVYGVINAKPSFSGRFPSAGPLLLVRAGIILIDAAGSGASEVRDGERVRIVDGTLMRGDQVVVEGQRRADDEMLDELDRIRAGGGALVRAEALVADAVAILRATPGVVDGGAADPALVHLIDGRAVVVVAADLTTQELALVRQATSEPSWLVVAADERSAADLSAVGLVADAVMTNDPVESTADGPLASSPVVGGTAFEAAVVSVLTAGAPVVVPIGAGAHDLVESLDQPRATAASAAVARMVGAGRVVHVETLRALSRATPLATAPRSRRADRGRPAWVAPAAVGVVGVLAGLALGLGPAAGLGGNDDALPQAQAARDLFQQRASVLGTEVAEADAFAARAQQALVAGRLSDRRLVLIVAPGVSADVVTGTRTVVEQAGGTWSGTITATDVLLDPDRASSLDDIALRLSPPETEFPPSGPAGVRRNAALAASVLLKTGERQPSAASAGFLAALEQVGAIQIGGEPQRRGALAVLLVPAGEPGSGSEALVALARSLGATGGVVVATGADPASSATLVALRAASPPAAQVSTVDGVRRAIGRVAIVDASQAAFDGSFGAFGPTAAAVGATSGGSTPRPTPSG